MGIRIRVIGEDVLHEEVVKRIIRQFPAKYEVVGYDCRGGMGRISDSITAINRVARSFPHLVIVDLDQRVCAGGLINEWLNGYQEHNLILRVAVREVEAWLLADNRSISEFLGVSRAIIPGDVEAILDPKQTLINIARKSRFRKIREGIVPQIGTTATIGREYNGLLSAFIEAKWDPSVAKENSLSLEKAISAISSFQPTGSAVAQMWPR